MRPKKKRLCGLLLTTPRLANDVLACETQVEEIAKGFTDYTSALFIGRSTMFPLALEGALKLKEISYIHAEGFAAGELKHGSIALVDESVPIITIAPDDELFDKTVSNMQEVLARGGKVVMLGSEAGIAKAGRAAWQPLACRRWMRSFRRYFMLCRCNCWLITPLSPKARMSISHAIWLNLSQWNNHLDNLGRRFI